MEKMYELLRDGKHIMQGTYMEIMTYIHRTHCYSLDHALRFEGYSIL